MVSSLLSLTMGAGAWQVLLRSSRKESDTMLQDVLSIKACLSDYNLVPDSITFNSVLNAAAVSRVASPPSFFQVVMRCSDLFPHLLRDFRR